MTPVTAFCHCSRFSRRGFRSYYKWCFFRSIRQAKKRVLLEVFYFFLYTGGKGGDAFGTTGIQLFFKTYYAVVLR